MCMARDLSLRLSRQGAWIINVTKHLLSYSITMPGLSQLDNILFAGKCGSLLIKLAADETEHLPLSKVTAHARLCGIGGPELPVYLEVLKSLGCVDSDQQSATYEVLAFSRQRVLETTSWIFNSQPSSPVEKALPYLLDFCLTRPRLQSELKDYLSDSLSEQDVERILGLVETFELLGVFSGPASAERLYFNGYQFGDRAANIAKALRALSHQDRAELDNLLEEVAKRPGVLRESIGVSERTKKLAIALGLVEVSEVPSPAGSAKFVTMPRLAPPSVGRETSQLEDDVFHHAKMLLSSIRFGQFRSSRLRGQIDYPATLVRALVGRTRVGPCTAIGEDYVFLEGEGVIRTIPAEHMPGRQFYMELRRQEPAEIVLGLLESGASGIIDAKSLPRSLELPLTYIGPEGPRTDAFGKVVRQDPETIQKFLEELRT